MHSDHGQAVIQTAEDCAKHSNFGALCQSVTLLLHNFFKIKQKLE